MPLAGDDILASDFPDAKSTVQVTDETGFTDTAYAAGAAECGVTFVTNTWGIAKIEWEAWFESNTANVAVRISFELREGATIGSGTVVVAANDERALQSPFPAAGGGESRTQASTYYVASGLTPNATYNARTMHRMSAAGNGDIFNRSILVTGLAGS